MSGSKLRVGIVGAGGVVRQFHLPGWKKLKNVEVVAIADLNIEAAEQLASQYDVPTAMSNYQQMLGLDIDIVDICTPNRVHLPVAIDALNAGKHVLCEKPLSTTTGEVRTIGELADRRNLKLMTAQMFRFAANSVAIKQWAEAGNMGEVYHAQVRAMRRAWMPATPGFIDINLSGGGPCMDIGVHILDLCLWMMNFPKPVRASGATMVNFAKGYDIPGVWGEWDRSRVSVEDFAVGLIHFENGATMTLETAWLGHQSEDEDMSFRLYGKKAGVKWPAAEMATVQEGLFVQGTIQNPHSVASPYDEEIRAFADCIINNKPSPVPWTETIKVIAILEAIYASQKKGREMQVAL